MAEALQKIVQTLSLQQPQKRVELDMLALVRSYLLIIARAVLNMLNEI